MVRILKWTARNLVPHQETICLPQKHDVLAQLVRKWICWFKVIRMCLNNWPASKGSIAKPRSSMSIWSIIYTFVFFSVWLSLETTIIRKEKYCFHRIPFARAAWWNRTRAIPRYNRASWMNDFKIVLLHMMLNTIVCKHKSIHRIVSEIWE